MSCNILLHTQASFISLPRLYEFEAFLHKQSQKYFPDQIFFSWYVPVYHTGTASIFGMHRNRRKTNISESQIQVHSFWTQNTLMRFSSTT